jgi:hypothetical protein
MERLVAEDIHIVPPPAPAAEPDPIKTAETVLALADLLQDDRPPVAKARRSRKPSTPTEVKGADR